MSRTTTHYRTLLLALLIVAAGLRLWQIDWGLPQLLHPDEWSQADVAARIAAGDPNPHFFRYGSLTVYLLALPMALAECLAGPLAQPQRYLLARCFTALLGTAAVWLLWRWAALLLPAAWALGAAALLALLPLHVAHSRYATVDVPLSLLFALCGYALTRLAQATPAQHARHARLAACAVGLALSVKYTAALLLLPLLVLVVIGSNRQDAKDAKNTIFVHPALTFPFALLRAGLASWRLLVAAALLLALAPLYRINMPRVAALAAQLSSDGRLEREYLGLLELPFWAALAGGVAALLLALPRFERQARALLDPLPWQCLALIGLVFLGTSPFVLLDYRHAAVDIFYEYRHALVGPEAHAPEGSGLAQRATLAENAALYSRQLASDFGLALPLAVLGLLLSLRRGRPGLALALPPLLLLAALLRSGNTGARYLLPAYPALCLAVALGLYYITAILKKGG